MSMPAGGDFTFIDDPVALQQWCDHTRDAGFAAIDTEFERSRTYFAQLCLVQVATDNAIACIDPMDGIDLAPIFSNWGVPGRHKILHAARQDLEVLHFAGARDLTPLLDTQIAAALCGFSEQIGYAELAHELLGVTLDKSQTRTDWRRRPLSPRQLAYAADDVRHLGAISSELSARLEARGRLAWWHEDCARLYDPSVIDPPAAQAWQRVKGTSALGDAAFARAVALATWREETARQRNLPRGWVLKDAELVAVAERAPRTLRELGDALQGDARSVRRHGDTLLELLLNPPAAPARNGPLSPAERKHVKALAADVTAVATALDMPPSCLLTRKEMEQLIRGSQPARLDSGWRRQELATVLAQHQR